MHRRSGRLKLDINAAGHVQLKDGRTTDPLTHPVWYVGTPKDLVSFAYMVLPDGRVAIHSAVNSPSNEIAEDFLYEIAGR